MHLQIVFARERFTTSCARIRTVVFGMSLLVTVEITRMTKGFIAHLHRLNQMIKKGIKVISNV